MKKTLSFFVAAISLLSFANAGQQLTVPRVNVLTSGISLNLPSCNNCPMKTIGNGKVTLNADKTINVEMQVAIAESWVENPASVQPRTVTAMQTVEVKGVNIVWDPKKQTYFAPRGVHVTGVQKVEGKEYKVEAVDAFLGFDGQDGYVEYIHYPSPGYPSRSGSGYRISFKRS
jgi:hypothetical protein